jgi:hypothetical protein
LEGSSGISKGKTLSMVGPEIPAVDERYHKDDELESTFFRKREQPALSLFDVVVRLRGFALESSNFIFIFAIQGGIIRQVSQLFLRLILHFVKLALDHNCAA